MKSPKPPLPNPLAATASFDLLRPDLAGDLQASLTAALAGGVVFADGADPLAIFRSALAGAIRDIERHPRGKLFQDFLLKGPHDTEGPIPDELRSQRLTDEETARVVDFITGHMVNSFKGALAELLAASPCLDLFRQLQRSGAAPAKACLFAGDAVKALQLKRRAFAKSADFHFFAGPPSPGASPAVTLLGTGEVKSNFTSPAELAAQTEAHRLRARRGLRVLGQPFVAPAVHVGPQDSGAVFVVTVEPDDWTLPRTLRWEPTANGRQLHLDPGAPTHEHNRIEQVAEHEWRIVLRWSHEALAATAYAMTFWYMEKVGEVIYSDPKNLPANWSEMSPAEAGRNAAKQMLHYAVFRFLGDRSDPAAHYYLTFEKAVGLYNTYGFGFALGMHYRGDDGLRDMLYPQDLDEIATSGATAHGGKIVH